MRRPPRSWNRLAFALGALVAGLPVHAVEYAVGDGKLSVTGSVTAGSAWRTQSQDTSLLPNVNSSQVGITGTAIAPTAGRNQDDGNLNFNKGDPVSQVVNGYLALDYKAVGDWGAAASAKAWYDYALEDASHPWGNIPNGYTPNAPLSDGGVQPRTRFSGAVLDNLNVYGHHSVSGAPLDWTLGWQKLDWGNRFIVLGGLRDLNPIDIPAFTRPGMLQRDQETRISVPQIFARLGVSKTTSVEGFYQFHFERNAPSQCGTFYVAVDYFSDGCNAVTLGNASDRVALATGNFIARAPNVLASNSGQGGLALLHTVEEWETKFGLYATQFHSRQGFSGIYKSLRGGAPFIPADPDGLNPRYFTEFPENIHMFGGTFETKIRGGTVFGELTYRPNQPLQYNAADLVAAAISNVAPTTLRDKINALGPGGTLNGYERHKNVQLQLGETGQIQKVLGAAGLNWGAEVVYKGRGRSMACARHRRWRSSARAMAMSHATPGAIASLAACAIPMWPMVSTSFPRCCSARTSRAGRATPASSKAASWHWRRCGPRSAAASSPKFPGSRPGAAPTTISVTAAPYRCSSASASDTQSSRASRAPSQGAPSGTHTRAGLPDATCTASPSRLVISRKVTWRLPLGWITSSVSPTAKRFLVSTSAQPSARTDRTSPTNWLRCASELPVR